MNYLHPYPACRAVAAARSGRSSLATASTLGCSQGLLTLPHGWDPVFGRRYRASATVPCTDLLQARAPFQKLQLERPQLQESRLARRRCSATGQAVRLPKKDCRDRVRNSGLLLQFMERRCRYISFRRACAFSYQITRSRISAHSSSHALKQLDHDCPNAFRQAGSGACTSIPGAGRARVSSDRGACTE